MDIDHNDVPRLLRMAEEDKDETETNITASQSVTEKVSQQEKDEDEDDDDEEEEEDRLWIQCARQALLEAVVVEDMNSDITAQDANHDETQSLSMVMEALLALFVSSSSSSLKSKTMRIQRRALVGVLQQPQPQKKTKPSARSRSITTVSLTARQQKQYLLRAFSLTSQTSAATKSTTVAAQRRWARKFFTTLHPHVTRVVQERIVLSVSNISKPHEREKNDDNHSDHSDNDDATPPPPPPRSSPRDRWIALEFLQLVAQCVQTYAHGLVQVQSQSQYIRVDEVLFGITRDLHSVLFALHPQDHEDDDGEQDDSMDADVAMAVQETIVQLCEFWITHPLVATTTTGGSVQPASLLQVQQQQQRDQLIQYSLPLLAHACLMQQSSPSTSHSRRGIRGAGGGGVRTTVKQKQNHNPQPLLERLWHMRHAIARVDFTQPDSHELQHMLLQLVASTELLLVPQQPTKTSSSSSSSTPPSTTPVVLSVGAKLLAFLMGSVDPVLLGRIHQCIRAQLPHFKTPPPNNPAHTSNSNNNNNISMALLNVWGECYVRAWKEAPSERMRHALETIVFHDWVHAALHMSHTPRTSHRPPPLFDSLLRILQPLHVAARKSHHHNSNNDVCELQALLVRLYAGVLARSLASPHGHVRAHAITLWGQVFPLRSNRRTIRNNSSTPTTTPTSSSASAWPLSSLSVAMDQGMHMLHTTLHDPDPYVRIAAVQATRQILTLYGSVLLTSNSGGASRHLVQACVHVIIMKHASDRSSAAVRTAAVDCICGILSGSSSSESWCLLAAVLRPWLPVLGNLLHDTAESVRLAVVRLLVKVKVLPGIQYYHVVPVPHLLAQLAAESTCTRKNSSGSGSSSSSSSAVAIALTGLLANSYCPSTTALSTSSKAAAVDAMNRAIQLVKHHPVAASVLYRNLHRHVSNRSVIETLATNLFQYVHKVIVKLRRRLEKQKCQSKNAEPQTPFNRTTIVWLSNLVDTISILIRSITTHHTHDQPKDSSFTAIARGGNTHHGPNTVAFLQALDGRAVLDVLMYFESIASSSNQLLPQAVDPMLFEKPAKPVVTNEDVHHNDQSSVHRQDDDDDEEEVDWKSVSFRAMAAILSMVADLPSQGTTTMTAQGMILNHIIENRLSVLSNDDTNDDQQLLNPCNPAAIPIFPYLSLLCQCNMTEDVAIALARSIDASFEADFTINFSSPEVGSRKRKSTRFKSSKSNAAGPTMATAVPQMPPRIALDALSALLCGMDESSSASRESILASSVASAALERALVRGTKYAERILQAAASVTASSVAAATNTPNKLETKITASENEIEYILLVCEVYGRFAIHKDAFENEQGKNSETSKGITLMQWCNTYVVPVLTFSSPSPASSIEPPPPFMDPDLSRISIDPSLDDLRLSSPGPTGPPRRRRAQLDSPNDVHHHESSTHDTSLLSPVVRRLHESRKSASTQGRNMAWALMHSCLILISERLAVGMMSTTTTTAATTMVEEKGVDGIVVDTLVQWYTVLVTFESNAADPRLLALSSVWHRLAFSLAKHSASFVLLKELIIQSEENPDPIVCNEDATNPTTNAAKEEAFVSMEMTVMQLLSCYRGNRQRREAFVYDTVQCVVEAATTLLANGSDGLGSDADAEGLLMPLIFSAFFSASASILASSSDKKKRGCWSSAFKGILASRAGCLALASSIMNRFNDYSQERNAEAKEDYLAMSNVQLQQEVFWALCLSWLCGSSECVSYDNDDGNVDINHNKTRTTTTAQTTTWTAAFASDVRNLVRGWDVERLLISTRAKTILLRGVLSTTTTPSSLDVVVDHHVTAAAANTPIATCHPSSLSLLAC